MATESTEQPLEIPFSPPTIPAVQTSLVELKAEKSGQIGLFTSESFALSQRIGNMFAVSDLVPKAFKGNIANCVIALNMANRIGADPLMVMQNLYVVHGTPSWSAQFLIATFNSCGRFSAIRYDFTGNPEDDTWGCRACAIEKETGEKLVGPLVTIALAKKEGWFSKSGSKWQTMPEQMLRYRSASWFVRAYAPELAMGLHTEDELRDVPLADSEPLNLEHLRTAHKAMAESEAK